MLWQKNFFSRTVCFSLIILFINSVSLASNSEIAPELATGVSGKPLVYAKHAMVVTNNPWASKAALEILEQGGNATDAAIAAGFVLGLTEPQSSGIGGGGYALAYTKAAKQLVVFDGRETAPGSATPNWFLDNKQNPISFKKAMFSAKSIGVPGEVALFYKMHQSCGRLPWSNLMQPAINLARKGFPMSPRLYVLLKSDQELLPKNPAIKSIYFTPDGQVKAIGTKVINLEYAHSLELIAKDPQIFYSGVLGTDIVNKVNQIAGQQLYQIQDLTKYKVITTKALCSNYRKYTICSIPPSSSGGITLLELMKIYANQYTGHNYNDLNWVYNFLEASKLAYADRNQYIADPRFVPQPVVGLLANNYISSRSKLIDKQALIPPVAAGMPLGVNPKYAPDLSPKQHGTTSVAVVDRQGNAISMTITIEHQFGSHVFVDGFFLNNELSDFSFIPNDTTGRPIANRIEAGKRPRSSIASAMVFNKDNQLQVIAGSPGGNQIICYVAKNLIQILDFNLDVARAAASPNLCATNDNPEVEIGTNLLEQTKPLQAKGELIIPTELVSGETNIAKAKNGGWYGAADPRREGIALGN